MSVNFSRIWSGKECDQGLITRIFHMMIAQYIGFTRNFLKSVEYIPHGTSRKISLGLQAKQDSEALQGRIHDYGRLKKIFLWNQ